MPAPVLSATALAIRALLGSRLCFAAATVAAAGAPPAVRLLVATAQSELLSSQLNHHDPLCFPLPARFEQLHHCNMSCLVLPSPFAPSSVPSNTAETNHNPPGPGCRQLPAWPSERARAQTRQTTSGSRGCCPGPCSSKQASHNNTYDESIARRQEQAFHQRGLQLLLVQRARLLSLLSVGGSTPGWHEATCDMQTASADPTQPSTGTIADVKQCSYLQRVKAEVTGQPAAGQHTQHDTTEPRRSASRLSCFLLLCLQRCWL